MTSMHIGMFTDVYKPSINGVTSSIELFRASLLARGHQVTVFAPQVPNEPSEAAVIRLPSVGWFSPKDFPIGLPVTRRFAHQVSELKLDIIHTHQPFFISQFGRRMASKLRLPHIHTYHTHLTEYAHYFPASPARPWVKTYLENLSRTFCNATDVTIAPSRAIEELLHSYGVLKPIIVNPTGINLDDYQRLSPKRRRVILDRYQIPTDRLVILFAGRLAQEKNLPFLLACFAQLVRSYQQLYLVFAGGGPEEQSLKEAIRRRQLEASVTMTGYLSQTAMRQVFGAADIFAFPSTTETQGIVVCEAQASGLPVVAMNAMGPKDIIRHGVDGYLVEPTPTAFIEALTRLITNPGLRRSMGRAGRSNSRRFSLTTTTDRLEKIYTEARSNHS